MSMFWYSQQLHTRTKVEHHRIFTKLEKQKAPLCCEKSGNGDNDGLGGVAMSKHLNLAFVKIFKIYIFSKPTRCKFESHVVFWQFLARKKMIKNILEIFLRKKL